MRKQTENVAEIIVTTGDTRKHIVGSRIELGSIR
jgi:hypothetical protein